MLQDRPLYNEEHRLFRQSVRRFFEAELLPHQAQFEADHIVPKALWRKAAEQGFLCPQMPESLGGLGLDFRYNAIINEELNYTGASGFAICGQNDLCVDYILNFGNPAQQQRWAPAMMRGELIAAIAMTEPGTGSDLKAVQSRARRDGDDYIVNGAKTFITAGQSADLVVAVVKTDPSLGARGISLLVIEAETPGFERGRNLKKMGMQAQDTSELFFRDMRVPAANLLGEEGQGFAMLMRQLPQERLSIAIGAQAAAQKAFDITVDYVKQRKAFGQAIIDFQNTRFKLAEMKANLTLGWTYIDRCIADHVAGALTVENAAIAKYWITEMQGRLVDQCLQLHGGYGFMDEYLISRLYRDARVQRIYGGTSEIMLELIGRGL